MHFMTTFSWSEEREKDLCQNKEEFFQTEHEISIQGKKINYIATVGSLLLKDDNCKPTANFFFISYAKKDQDAKRPVTFCFNGGPGSSSVWLHMGLAGPKRIAFKEDGSPELPYNYVDNETSLLDLTDLVFIDPISTGYSRAIPANEAKKFHGVEEDIKSVATFIELYLSQFNRWESPKFIIGESYGTTRATALTEYLRNTNFIDINGVLLISSVLNFQTLYFHEGNDLPYPLFLPSYTATALYHNKLSQEFQQDFAKTLQQAKDFATDEYTTALFKGDSLSQEERKKVAQKLADFTGLSLSYLENSNLRVNMLYFAKELLREQKKTVGLFDSRILGTETAATQGSIEYDPSMDTFTGVFTATFNHYLHNELACPINSPYKILVDVFPWNYSCDNKYFNASKDLSSSMTKNAAMRVFVASGCFDLATPFFATEYTMQHLRLDPSIQKHLILKNYQGGHMMYIIPSIRKELKQDIANFYKETLH